MEVSHGYKFETTVAILLTLYRMVKTDDVDLKGLLTLVFEKFIDTPFSSWSDKHYDNYCDDFDEDSAIYTDLHVVFRDGVLFWNLQSRGVSATEAAKRACAGGRAGVYRCLVLTQPSNHCYFFNARCYKVAARLQAFHISSKSLQNVILPLGHDNAAARQLLSTKRVTH